MSDPTPADAIGFPVNDLTLDELRMLLAEALPNEAAFDGWSDVALSATATIVGISPDRARLAFPDGATGMIDAWFAVIDRQMVAACPAHQLAAMKVRTRIETLVWTRIGLVAGHIEAMRRALNVLANPLNAMTAARLGWRAADVMWRTAGDTATGLAHYSKRLTLAGVYAATLLAMLDDTSEDQAATRAFLARRIDDVMRFEKLKSRLKPDPDRTFSAARLLGRLRYPAR